MTSDPVDGLLAPELEARLALMESQLQAAPYTRKGTRAKECVY